MNSPWGRTQAAAAATVLVALAACAAPAPPAPAPPGPPPVAGMHQHPTSAGGRAFMACTDCPLLSAKTRPGPSTCQEGRACTP